MLTRARGTVLAITRAEADAVELTVAVEGDPEPRTALAYPALSGPIAPGDSVVLNTTARDMKLGTGGLDFVIHNESRPLPETVGGTEGHIVKLRYTPLQHAVEAVEMDPRHAGVWESAETLTNAPVIVGNLHSQIAPAAAGVKAARPNARIAYVMTDAAALPLGLSRLVRDLKSAGLLDATLTAGQAFGGDYECVTTASALLAARFVARADVILVCQGPGNAGTGTRYGFSGIEQGMLLDLAAHLGGVAIGILRLSEAEGRERHRGLSHHSITALGRLAVSPALLAFPSGAPAALREAVERSPIARRHRIEEADGGPGIALLAARGLRVSSMGRTPEDDPVFFHAAAAAGELASRHLTGSD